MGFLFWVVIELDFLQLVFLVVMDLVAESINPCHHYLDCHHTDPIEMMPMLVSWLVWKILIHLGVIEVGPYRVEVYWNVPMSIIVMTVVVIIMVGSI